MGSDGEAVFSNPWFKFDVVLVAIGASVSWVLMPIVHHLDMADLPIINQVLTLRVLRLLRTVRAFRTMEMFSEMCRLCSGLLRSCRTMLSVCLVVMVAVFTFSVLGADLIFKSEKLRANDVTAVHDRGLPRGHLLPHDPGGAAARAILCCPLGGDYRGLDEFGHSSNRGQRPGPGARGGRSEGAPRPQDLAEEPAGPRGSVRQAGQRRERQRHARRDKGFS